MNKSKISWCDYTWQPVTGCTKVSQGCKNCYAEREVIQRWSKNPKSPWYGRSFFDVRCHPERLDEPLRIKKPQKIFVCPRGDLFQEHVPLDFIEKVFATIATCHLEGYGHVFQILTKRPERMYKFMSATQSILPNCWLGVSVEDQQTADERIPLLIKTPATLRFISAEPLLGQIDLFNYLFVPDPFTGDPADFRPSTSLSWVIAGGESGKNARPSHPDWFRLMRDQCCLAFTPFTFKQWGEWAPNCLCDTKHPHKTIERPSPGNRGVMFRCGTKRAGCELDGVTHNGNCYPRGAL